MAEPTPGAALRQLQQAQNGLRKARQTLRQARTGDADPQSVLKHGWDSLTAAYRTLAGVPLAAADDDVMSRQIAVQRYATALLVRLRRLARKGPAALEADEDDDLDDEV
jgi:hypothetical protein